MDTAPLQERALACESHYEYRHFYRGSTTESSEFSAITRLWTTPCLPARIVALTFTVQLAA